MDWGAVAVAYNLTNVCASVETQANISEERILRDSAQMCEPADIWLYRKFGGAKFERTFTSTLPMFYFTSIENMKEPSTLQNMDVGAQLQFRVEMAQKQRSAWAFFPRTAGIAAKSCCHSSARPLSTLRFAEYR